MFLKIGFMDYFRCIKFKLLMFFFLGDLDIYWYLGVSGLVFLEYFWGVLVKELGRELDIGACIV